MPGTDWGGGLCLLSGAPVAALVRVNNIMARTGVEESSTDHMKSVAVATCPALMAESD